jgi:hypothetical protein
MKYYVPLVTLMILHVIFLLLDAYSMPHLDSVLHLAGGVVLGIFLYGVLACAVSKGWCPDPGTPLTLILVVALVTTGAVCWEFYEWVSDTVFDTSLQLTVADTIKDLLLGLLGGLLYAGYLLVASPLGRRGIAHRSECRAQRSKG